LQVLERRQGHSDGAVDEILRQSHANGGVLAKFGHGGHGFIVQRQHALRENQKGPAGGTEGQALALAQEQGAAEHLLQPFDLQAERRLAEINVISGLHHGAVLDDGGEAAQGLHGQIDGHRPQAPMLPRKCYSLRAISAAQTHGRRRRPLTS
jgi:hypothetical protein